METSCESIKEGRRAGSAARPALVLDKTTVVNKTKQPKNSPLAPTARLTRIPVSILASHNGLVCCLNASRRTVKPPLTSATTTHSCHRAHSAFMSTPNSPSLFSDDAPPPPEPQQVSAGDLRSSHPLWERAAGRGPVARGGNNCAPSESGGDRPRFAPLSASALELLSFQADGAESSIADSAAGPSKQRRKRSAENEEDECVDAEDEEEESDSEPRQKKRAKRGDGGAQKAAMLATAAFGGSFQGYEQSDVESSTGCSQTSSVRRNAAQRAAFPVRGVTCVGCALATKIAPVTRYVNEYAARMAETALWKQAGLCYVREVVEPCKLEGVVAPPWSWRDIRAHYTMHVVDERLGRLGTLRLLALMRQQAEQRLLRIETDGNKELDKQTTEQVLKIVNMESRERNLLEASLFASAPGGARPKGKGQKSSE